MDEAATRHRVATRADDGARRQATVSITRRTTFAAGHILRNEAWDEARNREVFGGCSTDHGHNYVLEVTVAGPLDPATGMVVNLKRLDRLIREVVLEDLDHRHLSRDVDWLQGVLATTENLALAIWERLEGRLAPIRLERIKLSETENNSAEVTRR
jgi:6-pyruvoyltetrahydropterin/6-carboxytetrahydropterin synthase